MNSFFKILILSQHSPTWHSSFPSLMLMISSWCCLQSMNDHTFFPRYLLFIFQTAQIYYFSTQCLRFPVQYACCVICSRVKECRSHPSWWHNSRSSRLCCDHVPSEKDIYPYTNTYTLLSIAWAQALWKKRLLYTIENRDRWLTFDFCTISAIVTRLFLRTMDALASSSFSLLVDNRGHPEHSASVTFVHISWTFLPTFIHFAEKQHCLHIPQTLRSLGANKKWYSQTHGSRMQLTQWQQGHSQQRVDTSHDQLQCCQLQMVTSSQWPPAKNVQKISEDPSYQDCRHCCCCYRHLKTVTVRHISNWQIVVMSV
jgi:hypothetical protein